MSRLSIARARIETLESELLSHKMRLVNADGDAKVHQKVAEFYKERAEEVNAALKPEPKSLVLDGAIKDKIIELNDRETANWPRISAQSISIGKIEPHQIKGSESREARILRALDFLEPGLAKYRDENSGLYDLEGIEQAVRIHENLALAEKYPAPVVKEGKK